MTGMTGGHSFLGIFDRGHLNGGSPIPATKISYFSMMTQHFFGAQLLNYAYSKL